MKNILIFLSLLMFISTLSFSADAIDHEIKAVGTKFSPAFIIIQPGDTVTWTNMPAHLVESIDRMSPSNSPKIFSTLGEDFTRTFDITGIHVYKCTPHWGLRMGGIILVGDPQALNNTIDQYFKEINYDKSLLPAKGLLKKFKKFLIKQSRLTHE